MGVAAVALVTMSTASVAAQGATWYLDVGATALVEAWDLNESREELAGLSIGLDRQVWRGLAVRAEATMLNIAQARQDGSVGGATIGTRLRWRRPFGRPFVDVGAGVSRATPAIPPRGTRFNFLIVSGGGVELPFGAVLLDLGIRWVHLSNNGREGRHRNPDVQSLGPRIAIGWNY